MSEPLDLDTIGLSIDMLDVDRLRDWARLLLVHGPDVSHWGSTAYVTGRMQTIATGIEKAIKDIGVLRTALYGSEAGPQEAREAGSDAGVSARVLEAVVRWLEQARELLAEPDEQAEISALIAALGVSPAAPEKDASGVSS